MQQNKVQMGDALAMLGQQFGLRNQDIEHLEQTCDHQPAEPINFAQSDFPAITLAEVAECLPKN